MAHKILVVDDEEIIRESLSFVLKKEGYIVEEAENGKAAYDKIVSDYFDVVITDLEMPGMKGIQLVEEIQKLNILTSIIIITAYGSLDTAISALRNGASDYILKPIEFDEILIKIKKLFEIKDLLLENRILRKEIQRTYDYENIVGKSSMIKNVYDMIETVAETDSTVLITGKSGTGKELVARALHFKSKRKNKAFIPVNCGAISENLIESELFGHKRGAFTGAISDKEGFFKAADGGTLFLDEVSELPLNLQVKFLRVLQEREFTPVGSTYPISVNIRFIASTNRDLKQEIKNGKFREDLFYRLNVIEINLPSLKERDDDIPVLADHFLNKYRKEMNKNVKGIDSEAMRALLSYDWKGEVRELENVIERAVIFSKEDFITLKDLPQVFKPNDLILNQFKSGSLEDSVKSFERDYIMRALENNEFDKEKTADVLKVGLSTLYRKMKELDIKA
jgi:two-component system response regulator PilR (NtrC family)